MGHVTSEREFLPLAIAVLTVSDSRTLTDDASGQTLVERLTAAGHRQAERAIVPDDIYRIRAVVSNWIADPAVQVVQAPLVPATAAPPATIAGRYIQVVAVSDEARAKALASVLADFGPAQALPTGSGLWRVRIGPVAADTADNVLFEVRAGGWPDARIVAP